MNLKCKILMNKILNNHNLIQIVKIKTKYKTNKQINNKIINQIANK